MGTNLNQAPVDVLAVMDRMIESNRRAGIAEVGDFAELIESRAAVYELIAEAQRVVDGTTADLHYLRAALTRVQGEQK